MMIKKVYLFTCFLLIFGQLKAQQSIKFAYKYLPNHNYLTAISTRSNAEINITGSPEDLKKFKASGANEKMILTGTMDMDYTVKSGSYTKDEIFPVLLTYNHIVSKHMLDGKLMPAKPNEIQEKKIFAHSDAGGKLKIDSIAGASSNKDSVIKVIASIMENFNREIKFPENGMKIGDSFTQDLPMNLPIMGSTVRVAMNLIYKLTGTKDDIAYFDVDQTAAFNLPTQYGPVNIKGAGNGKMEFSIKKSFPIKYDSNSELTYTMEIENLSIGGLIKINTVLTTKVD